jgi:subtilase family serine protease
MQKTMRALISGASLLAIAAMTTTGAFAAEQKHVAPWVAHAQRIGPASESEQIHVLFYLGYRNVDQLRDLVKSQYTRGNPLYGKFLTPDEFHARFSPDADKVALVADTLRGMGFTIESIPKSGFYVEVSGTVGKFKSALGVTQDLYSFQGLTLRANAESPKLPARIADLVIHIGGLAETGALRHPFHRLADEALNARLPAMAADLGGKAVPNAPPPYQTSIQSPACSTYFGDAFATLTTAAGPYGSTLPWLGCDYTPQQMQQAYLFSQSTLSIIPQTGAGVRIGIVDTYASPTIVFDVNTYSKNHGLPVLGKNFTQVIPKGIYNVPANAVCGPQGWYGEETLDIESAHSIAPGASITYFGASDCQTGLDVAVAEAIDSHAVDILSNSYGYAGEAGLPASTFTTDNELGMQAAAEGISLLYSSGDDSDNIAANGIASGDWPATSPYVTAVGGTSMLLENATGGKLEYGWGNYRAFLEKATVEPGDTQIKTKGLELPFAYYAGAGGGPSLSQLAPYYQASLPFDLSAYTYLANGSLVPFGTPHRLVPDIAMDADPYTGFLYGETFSTTGVSYLDAGCKAITETTEYCEEGIGGTSLASPSFAAVLALVDQARFAKGMGPIGFANPALYSIPVGSADGLWTQPIIDVVPPSSPTAVLRGYVTNPNEVRVVTINSYSNGKKVYEGVNTTEVTTVGWDEVTGLGWPNVPVLVQTLSKP